MLSQDEAPEVDHVDEGGPEQGRLVEHRIRSCECQPDHDSDKEEGLLELADKLCQFIVSEDEEAEEEGADARVFRSCASCAKELQ